MSDAAFILRFKIARSNSLFVCLPHSSDLIPILSGFIHCARSHAQLIEEMPDSLTHYLESMGKKNVSITIESSSDEHVSINGSYEEHH